ncbi:MAG: SPOR domain-containing protein [Halorhodospira sp.]
MDPSTRRQLVGAAVLIALAVIFLPMLLSNPEEAQEVEVPVEVPSRDGEAASPEGEAGQAPAEGEEPSGSPSQQLPGLLDEPVPQLDDSQRESSREAGEPAASEPSEEPAANEPSEEPAANEPAEEPAANEPSEEPAASEPSEEPAASEPAEEPAASGSDDGADDASAADEAATQRGGDSGQAAPSAAAEGDYAVQVGSFSEQGNAQSLRDRLRGVDLPAYVATAEVDGATRYRVRLGPTDGYSEAEALLDRAAEAADLEGFVLTR